MDTLYYILSVISAALWIPILTKFYKSWYARQNPVSLAICSLILLILWMAAAGVWIFSSDVSQELITVCSSGLSAMVAIVFHVAFYWSDHRFTDSRSG